MTKYNLVEITPDEDLTLGKAGVWIGAEAGFLPEVHGKSDTEVYTSWEWFAHNLPRRFFTRVELDDNHSGSK